MDLILANRTLAMWLLAAIAVVCVLYLTVSYGEQRAHEQDAIALAHAKRQAADSATVEALRAVTPVKRANDSLQLVNASLSTKADSLNRLANERRTAANIVRSRMVIRQDTLTLATDSGPVKYEIPLPVAKQLADEHMAVDSAFNAMERRHDAGSALVHGLIQENMGLRVQIQLDSTLQVRYRAEVAAAEAEADAAAKASKPRWTFVQGITVGAVATVAARIAVAALVHR